MAKRKVADRQVGGERSTVFAELPQTPLGCQGDAAGFDTLKRSLLLLLVLYRALAHRITRG